MYEILYILQMIKGGKMTQQEKLAWVNAVFWGAFLVFSIIFFILKSPLECWENKTLRGLLIGIWLLGLIIDVTFRLLSRIKKSQEKVKSDERDILILNISHKAALMAVAIFYLLCCFILTEIYWNQGMMPVKYLYFILFYSWVIFYVFFSITSLINYRRM